MTAFSGFRDNRFLPIDSFGFLKERQIVNPLTKSTPAFGSRHSDSGNARAYCADVLIPTLPSLPCAVQAVSHYRMLWKNAGEPLQLRFR